MGFVPQSLSGIAYGLYYALFSVVPEQLFSRLSAPTPDLKGRTYLVTGANAGLGLATAVHLARLKPETLILATRTKAKGEGAKKDVLEQTGFRGKVEVWELELEDFESVRAFAGRAKGLERLDGVVLNAGLHAKEWEKTKDGWERVLQVNGIATGLLAVSLLPVLQTTSKLPDPNPDAVHLPPHLTLTGSGAQYRAQLPAETDILQALNDPEKTDKAVRYPASKLINLFTARETAKLPAAEGVVVNVAHPGLVYTEIARDYKFGFFTDFIFRTFGWSPAKGALNLQYAVLSPTPSGSYIGACGIREPPSWVKTAHGAEIQKRLWDEMCTVWRKVAPEVESVVGA
ncbi:ATP-dependent DNA helicase PIF1 [Mycena chlorophos]|uniref:ATP-dependent DNA helicase PIF1 n=1 Tax=Mycena chlorophos TaxID=658473 RepID=A0A8H6WDC7_MYCCL|nr:ATP-dependent DNA helicase PIF1 [Mycena chlorophos]